MSTSIVCLLISAVQLRDSGIGRALSARTIEDLGDLFKTKPNIGRAGEIDYFCLRFAAIICSQHLCASNFTSGHWHSRHNYCFSYSNEKSVCQLSTLLYKYLPDDMYSITLAKNEILKLFPVTTRPSYVVVNGKVIIGLNSQETFLAFQIFEQSEKFYQYIKANEAKIIPFT